MNIPFIPAHTNTRALLLASAADLAQIPLLAFGSPGHGAILFLNALTYCVLSRLLGFRWPLVVSVIAESLPMVAGLPGWTGCVYYCLYHKDKKRFLAPTAMDSPIAVTQVIADEPSTSGECISGPISQNT